MSDPALLLSQKLPDTNSGIPDPTGTSMRLATARMCVANYWIACGDVIGGLRSWINQGAYRTASVARWLGNWFPGGLAS